MSNKNTALLKLLNDLLYNLNSEGFAEELNKVVQRQGGYTRVSKSASLNRESLYKALSGARDPRFSTVLKLLSTLGIKLKVELDRDSLEERLHNCGGFEGPWLELYLMNPDERITRSDEAITNLNDLSILHDTDN